MRQTPDHTEPAEPIVDENPGRPITFEEFRSLSNSVSSWIRQEEQRLRRERRDRLIGWFLTALFTSVIAWLWVGQVNSEQELRQSLYNTCTSTNAERADTATFYRQIRVVTGGHVSPQFDDLLTRTIKQLEQPRDCVAKYLRGGLNG